MGAARVPTLLLLGEEERGADVDETERASRAALAGAARAVLAPLRIATGRTPPAAGDVRHAAEVNPDLVLADLRAVVFDVGETLVDESRAWSEQARTAGVTPFSLMAAIGSVISQRRDHRDAWSLLGSRRQISRRTSGRVISIPMRSTASVRPARRGSWWASQETSPGELRPP